MNKYTTHKRQAGSTLIEVLIALFVFTIGLQGIASMQYQSVKDNFDSAQRSHGMWAAQELIERIRANPTGRADGDYDFNGDPCDGSPAETLCADTSSDDAATCSPAEMAVFDIWESMCPTPNQSHSQNEGQLLNPNLIIACVGACSEDAEIDLTLQWQSKSVSDDNIIEDDDDALKTEQFRQVFRP
jgi:type IV pilus assembly protein PilV